jgi:DDE_Tnp_1-associated
VQGGASGSRVFQSFPACGELIQAALPGAFVRQTVESQVAVDMATCARSKETFFRGFLRLKNGLPSHDNFSSRFRLLDPNQFRTAFQRFMAGFAETLQGVIAIDRKVMRRPLDKASGKSALHMVSVWGSELGIVAFGAVITSWR